MNYFKINALIIGTSCTGTSVSIMSNGTMNAADLYAVPDLILIQNEDGTYVDYHVTGLHTLSVDPQDFLGKRMEDLVPPEFVKSLRDTVERAVVTGDIHVHEYRLKVHGVYEHFEARIIPVGKDRVVSIVKDMSSFPGSDRAGAKWREQLRLLTDYATDIIYTLDQCCPTVENVGLYKYMNQIQLRVQSTFIDLK